MRPITDGIEEAVRRQITDPFITHRRDPTDGSWIDDRFEGIVF